MRFAPRGCRKETSMREYIVYRHGGDKATEGETMAGRDERPVARLFAGDPAEACRLASAQVSLSQGQWLSAEPADQVDAKVNEIGLRQEALNEVDNPEGEASRM